MSATNSTTNYHLPIFLGTDVPSWLTDWNSAMSDIDIAIAAAKTTADAAQLTASNAQNAATTNAGAISTLQTTVAGQGNSITTLSGSVNTINSLIGNGLPTTTDQTIIGAINELHANQGDLTNLTTTDKSSLVAAINEAAQGGGAPTAAQVSYDNTGSGLTATDVQAAIDELEQSIPSGNSKTAIGSSTANTSYSAQLTEIETLFNGLTAAQKRECYIQDVTGNLFKCETTTGNVLFNACYVYNSNVNLLTLNLTAHSFDTATIGSGSPSFNSQTSATFTESYTLYA